MNKKKAGVITSALVLLGGVSGYLVWDNSYNFTTGTKGKSLNSDGYFADFENFNGTDIFELQLEKGEKIHLDAQIDDGKADFWFYHKGEKRGTSITDIIDVDTDFTANESCRYVIEVRAKHAKGEINVIFDENRKDKTVYNTSKVNAE